MELKKALGLATRAVHVGQGPDPATGAVVVPIHLATTFVHESPGRHKGFEYSRSGNPTRNNLEACLASLEGARHGLAFSSGLAATTAVVLLLDPGDHVVLTEDVYGGTFRLFDQVFSRYGITFTSVDPSDVDAIAAAMTDRTRLVWLESPTNPLLRVVDIDAVSEIVHGAGAIFAVDSTFASPVLQRPLELGADIVVHSSTKFLGGHSDVLGGAVLTSDDVPRGTVALPPERCRRGAVTVRLLAAAPRVEDVAIARPAPVRQRSGNRAVARRSGRGDPGALPGSREQPRSCACPTPDGRSLRRRRVLRGLVETTPRVSFLERLRVFTLAESLGAVESLAESPALMTHASIPEEIRTRVGVSDGLLRLSVGIEDVDDLVADLEQALA